MPARQTRKKYRIINSWMNASPLNDKRKRISNIYLVEYRCFYPTKKRIKTRGTFTEHVHTVDNYIDLLTTYANANLILPKCWDKIFLLVRMYQTTAKKSVSERSKKTIVFFFLLFLTVWRSAHFHLQWRVLDANFSRRE